MPDDALQEGAEKRLERRVAAALPVALNDMAEAQAITRDVSASGLFLETDADISPGSIISLVVEIDTPAGKRVLRCRGSVVRVEKMDTRLGCAVRILESQLAYPQGSLKEPSQASHLPAPA